MLQVFESHAGILTGDCFNTFLLPYIKEIAKGVKNGLKDLGINVPMVRNLLNKRILPKVHRFIHFKCCFFPF